MSEQAGDRGTAVRMHEIAIETLLQEAREFPPPPEDSSLNAIFRQGRRLGHGARQEVEEIEGEANRADANRVPVGSRSPGPAPRGEGACSDDRHHDPAHDLGGGVRPWAPQRDGKGAGDDAQGPEEESGWMTRRRAAIIAAIDSPASSRMSGSRATVRPSRRTKTWNSCAAANRSWVSGRSGVRPWSRIAIELASHGPIQIGR